MGGGERSRGGGVRRGKAGAGERRADTEESDGEGRGETPETEAEEQARDEPEGTNTGDTREQADRSRAGESQR